MAGPYQYGQQMYGNSAESLLSGLAPDAQVALANTLLSTILQGQAPGSNPSYGMYQQSQSYQEMNYRDNRGYRNETMQRGQRYGVNRQLDEYRRIGMEGSKGVFKKKNRRPWKVTCDMCDVSFFGSIYAHRANHAHQTLKNFLHSSCGICKENFRMKINHDHHQLTAGHIKKLVEINGGTAEHPDVIDEVLEELKFIPTEKATDVEGLESGAPPVPKDTEFDINLHFWWPSFSLESLEQWPTFSSGSHISCIFFSCIFFSAIYFGLLYLHVL